jgi:uncharacterized membrane protein YfbV (UPF0208 family)
MITLTLEKHVLRTIYKALIAKRERITGVFVMCKEHNSPCFQEQWWHEWVTLELQRLDEAINLIEQDLHPNLLEDIKKK